MGGMIGMWMERNREGKNMSEREGIGELSIRFLEEIKKWSRRVCIV